MKVPPTDDELEIYVFGKGYGESILLNCGKNRYVLIDSFLSPVSKKPIVLDFLSSLNIAFSSIKEVIITHWDSDHINGITDVLKASGKETTIVLDPIAKKEEFFSFIMLQKGIDENCSNEFYKLLSYIKENDLFSKIKWATVDKKVFGTETIDNAELIALSPNDNDITNSLFELKSFLEQTNHPSKRTIENNLFSIVFLLKSGSNGALLGGDMEVTTDKDRGWDAIADSYSYLGTKSSFYKVPHHGSENGHCEKVIQKMLSNSPKPNSVLTPFNKGKNPPPKASDIDRITRYSSSLYIVGEPSQKDADLKRMISKSGASISIEPVSSDVGMIRYRYNTKTNQSTIDCFGKVQEM